MEFIDKNKQIKNNAKRVGSMLYSLVRTIIVLGVCYYVLFPILQSVFQAFMARRDLYDSTVDLIPKNWTLDNFRIIFKAVDIPKATLNTALISLVVTATQLASCTLVGYGFARYDFPFKKILFGLVVFTLIVPVQTIVVPLYLNFRFFDILGIMGLFGSEGINVLNTAWPFVILGMTAMGFRNGLYIFLIRQFYRNVPKELEEAAMIDGAGFFKTFYRIMLPGAKPILSVVAILSFVWQWTDYFYSGWFASNISVLSNEISAVSTNLNVIKNILGVSAIEDSYKLVLNSTGALVIMIPIIILYLFTQRTFVESIERGGIVG
ncbi:MAG: carbohydrate ABC transporter permease [Clostridia bacterium]|nr:carbohydrate ABC transporter permease [Clostridia bacterium]